MDDQVLSVPPPILSRVFHELANGMVAFHDCMKIQATNVPLPYKQMTKILMGAHWFITPVVMCMWTDWITWTFIFTLIQSMIFWCLYFTAQQIEFPFQTGEISYSVSELHKEFNGHLVAMVQSKTGQVTGCQNDLDPASWVHEMKETCEDEKRISKQLVKRPSAVDMKELQSPAGSRGVECYLSRFDSERSAEVNIETPCVPPMDSCETWIETSGADECETSESMAKGKATVLAERQPNEQCPTSDISKNISHRRQCSIQPGHQPISPKKTADERCSLSEVVVHELAGNSSLHNSQGSLQKVI